MLSNDSEYNSVYYIKYSGINKCIHSNTNHVSSAVVVEQIYCIYCGNCINTYCYVCTHT